MSAARPYDVITFDCYGTLIDWDRGILGAFERVVADTGGRLDPRRALEVYEEIEAQVEAEKYRRYREVLTETARRVARRLDWALPESKAGFLPDSLPFWIPFPDTNAALERLFRAGYRLGILSNVDDDLLESTRRHFTVPFDLIVTAQQVGSYKPAAGHFVTARERLGDARWLHAAQSHFHDVTPAKRHGVSTAWINRKHLVREEPRPDRELSTLTELADWLAWRGSMPLEQTLNETLTQAIRAKDARTANVVRMLKTRIQERRTAKGASGEVDDALVLDVIGAYRKQLQKAVVEFEKAGERGAAQAADLRFEIAFCEGYLPRTMDEEAVRALVRERIGALGISDPKQAGRLVGDIMKTHKGQVEAGDVKRIAEELLKG